MIGPGQNPPSSSARRPASTAAWRYLLALSSLARGAEPRLAQHQTTTFRWAAGGHHPEAITRGRMRWHATQGPSGSTPAKLGAFDQAVAERCSGMAPRGSGGVGEHVVPCDPVIRSASPSWRSTSNTDGDGDGRAGPLSWRRSARGAQVVRVAEDRLADAAAGQPRRQGRAWAPVGRPAHRHRPDPRSAPRASDGCEFTPVGRVYPRAPFGGVDAGDDPARRVTASRCL